MNAPTEPPSGEITPEQRKILSSWLSSRHRDVAIELARTIAGDKPASMLQSGFVNDGPFLSVERAAAFLREMGMTTEERGDAHYIAQTHARLELLPSSAGTSATDGLTRRMGAFYGYPEQDVEWFIRTHSDERITPRERAETGDFTPAELAYTNFLSYMNEDSIGGYQRAIAEGKRIRELLTAIADEWNIPVIEEIAENHQQAARERIAGERDSVQFKLITKNPTID